MPNHLFFPKSLPPSALLSDLPTNVKILILSQPEQWIISESPRHIKRHYLATELSEDDVDRLVRSKLRKVAEFHEWNDWPSEVKVRRLCQLAAEILGLAATALRWIARQIEYEGSARRDEVIEEVSQLGTGEIDGLYSSHSSS